MIWQEKKSYSMWFHAIRIDLSLLHHEHVSYRKGSGFGRWREKELDWKAEANFSVLSLPAVEYIAMVTGDTKRHAKTDLILSIYSCWVMLVIVQLHDSGRKIGERLTSCWTRQKHYYKWKGWKTRRGSVSDLYYKRWKICEGGVKVVMSGTRLDMNVGKQTSLTRRY